MGESTNTVDPSVSASRNVFEGYKTHFDNHRTSTEAVMLGAIRQAHPDFYVTRTTSRQYDYAGFARAGFATMTLAPNENRDFSRTYLPPIKRLEGGVGFLKDHVTFAHWIYEWEDYSFIIYELEYRDVHTAPMRLQYVLLPRSDITSEKEGSHPTDRLLLAVGAWTVELHDELYVFDDGYWRKDNELWKSIQGAYWDDVILNQTTKSNLITDVHGFFDNGNLYKSLAVPWKRGLIFHGVPGNGKTITIKALVSEISRRDEPVPSLYVKAFDGCQGEKFSIRTIFRKARTVAPCLLIFEDLDSLITDKTRSYFLNEVDGLESNDGILMIGSTNHLDLLDPAISQRPSRFDRKYHFKLPDQDERRAYIEFWRKKLVDNEMVEFPEEICELIASLTEGFSFAYLKELFVIVLLTIAGRATSQEEHDEKEEVAAQTAVSDGENGLSEPAVIIEHETSPSGEKSEPKVKDVKKVTKKRVLPEIEVPESLKDNVLFKVVRAQTKILLDEMNNTKEEDWLAYKKRVPAGDDNAPPRRVRRGPVDPLY